jgi:hypothetical protein
MMIAPLRASPSFAATVNLTVPLPAADEPAVTVSHGTLATVHAQSPRVVMLVVRSPPVNGTSIAGGEIVKVHGAASWFRVKVCAAMVAVPVRAAPGFAAMFSCTDPAPVPAVLEAIVAQGTFGAAVHEQ